MKKTLLTELDKIEKKVEELRNWYIVYLKDIDILTPLEKLEKLESCGLFKVDKGMPGLLNKWHLEFIEIAKKIASDAHGYYGTIGSMIYEDLEHKYRSYSFHTILNDILEAWQDDNDSKEDNPIIPILYCDRQDITFDKYFNEICQEVLNYCLENKIYGFTYDW